MCILCVVVAHSKSRDDRQAARSMGIASIVLSVIGIVLGIIVIIIVIIFQVVGVKHVSDSLARLNITAISYRAPQFLQATASIHGFYRAWNADVIYR